MNKILILHYSRYWRFAPVGDDDFINRWKNFVYNFIGVLSYRTSDNLIIPHFKINKGILKRKLYLAFLAEIQVKYRNLSLTKQRIKAKKILGFYLNRVFENIGSRETEYSRTILRKKY